MKANGPEEMALPDVKELVNTGNKILQKAANIFCLVQIRNILQITKLLHCAALVEGETLQ